MRYVRWLLVIVVIGSSLPPHAAQAQENVARWTVLVYLDGDNNLERDALDDFAEMAVVGSSDALNIVVQFDRTPGYDARYGDWQGTLRFRVTKGMLPTPDNALADLGEQNMGDPRTLQEFVSWGMHNFPAKRFALVIWNHGDGWRALSLLKERRKAVCWDDTNGRDALDMAELRQALSDITDGGSVPIDLLAFDACLMAMIEVDAQIAPYARVRVASEDTEPGEGYPFHTILADLAADPDMTEEELARVIVERYYQEYEGETQSAVVLGDRNAALVAAVDRLARALRAFADSPSGRDVVRAVRDEVQFFRTDYVDLYDLAGRLQAAVDEEEVRVAAQEVMENVSAVTIHERHGPYRPNAHGTSIYFPTRPDDWDSRYAGGDDYLAFTAATQWDEFLMDYLKLGDACEPDEYEPDDSLQQAAFVEVNGASQRHNFCPAADAEDWVSFVPPAGATITITTFDLEPNCDTSLRLYDADGQLLAADDDEGSGRASQIVLTATQGITCYLRVVEYYGRTGGDTGYRLRVVAMLPVVRGVVRLQGRSSFGGTLVRGCPISRPVTTTADGSFVLTTTLPCTVTASHPGYLTARWPLTGAAAPVRNLEPTMLRAGDITGDGTVDILDIAYIGARFGSDDPLADLNGDGVVDILDLVLAAGNFGYSSANGRSTVKVLPAPGVLSTSISPP